MRHRSNFELDRITTATARKYAALANVSLSMLTENFALSNISLEDLKVADVSHKLEAILLLSLRTKQQNWEHNTQHRS